VTKRNHNDFRMCFFSSDNETRRVLTAFGKGTLNKLELLSKGPARENWWADCGDWNRSWSAACVNVEQTIRKTVA
jgi:hypothetical protein